MDVAEQLAGGDEGDAGQVLSPPATLRDSARRRPGQEPGGRGPPLPTVQKERRYVVTLVYLVIFTLTLSTLFGEKPSSSPQSTGRWQLGRPPGGKAYLPTGWGHSVDCTGWCVLLLWGHLSPTSPPDILLGAPARRRDALCHPHSCDPGHLVARGLFSLLSLVFSASHWCVHVLGPEQGAATWGGGPHGILDGAGSGPCWFTFFSCSVKCVLVSTVWWVVGLFGIIGPVTECSTGFVPTLCPQLPGRPRPGVAPTPGMHLMGRPRELRTNPVKCTSLEMMVLSDN